MLDFDNFDLQYQVNSLSDPFDLSFALTGEIGDSSLFSFSLWEEFNPDLTSLKTMTSSLEKSVPSEPLATPIASPEPLPPPKPLEMPAALLVTQLKVEESLKSPRLLNATFCNPSDFLADISSIDDFEFDSGSSKESLKGSDNESEFPALDVDHFFEENGKIPVTILKTADSSSIPSNSSTDKNRLGQDEDKATNTETKIDTTTQNLSLTPAFKAATEGQNRLTFVELAPRRAKEAARSKITACIKRKK